MRHSDIITSDIFPSTRSLYDAIFFVLQEDPEKWVGDQKLYPGFRFRDNRGETLAGEKFPSDITNDGEYKRPADFSRDCCSGEKVRRKYS